jgi:hypothetical protein
VGTVDDLKDYIYEVKETKVRYNNHQVLFHHTKLIMYNFPKKNNKEEKKWQRIHILTTT